MARRNQAIVLAIATAAALGVNSPSHAADRFWNNPAGGDFTVAANWLDGIAPGPGDDAYFGVGDLAHTVTFPASISNIQLTVAKHDVTFDLLGQEYQLTGVGSDLLTAPVRVGANAGDNAILRLQNGSLRTASTSIIGWVAGSEDNMIVSTLGRFDANSLDIGRFGIGRLRVENGGIVNSAEAILGTNPPSGLYEGQGYVTVVGTGSQWNNSGTIRVGNGRSGFVSIETGGTVTTQNAIVNGVHSTVTVSGADSRLNVSNQLTIGAGDGGQVNIGAGGLVSAPTRVTVTRQGGFNITGGVLRTPHLSLSGGASNTNGSIQITSSGELEPAAHGIFVGITGHGELIVNSGNLHTSGIASLAHGPGSSAQATITGSVAHWRHTGEFNVGANASLDLAAGGRLTTLGSAFIARKTGSISSVDLVGDSSWIIDENLYVGQSGSAQMNVMGGSDVSSFYAHIAANPGSTAHVAISGSFSHWGSAALFVGGSEFGPGGDAVMEVTGLTQVARLGAGEYMRVYPGGRIAINRAAHLNTRRLEIYGGRVEQGFFGALFISEASATVVAAHGTYIGTGGRTGVLDIANGGTLVGENETYIGREAASIGIATVHGLGSTWTTNNLFIVGSHGAGTLSIGDRATMTGTGTGFKVILGQFADGTGTLIVDSDGTILRHDRDIDVGLAGKGYASFRNSAVITSSLARVGVMAGSDGSVLLEGVGAKWNVSALSIGGTQTVPGGIGLVSVENTAILNVGSEITLWPTGRLNMHAGTIQASQLRLRGGTFWAYGNLNAEFSNGGGTIEVPPDQTLFNNGTLSSQPGGSLFKSGSGTMVISGPQSHNSGARLAVFEGEVVINTNAGTPATAIAPATAELGVHIMSAPALVYLGTDQDWRELKLDYTAPGAQSLDLHSPAAPGAFRSLRIYGGDKTHLWAAIVNANHASAANPFDGIFDSSLATHPSSGIGLAKVEDPFGETHLLIRPTRIGDLNLDGNVTIADFIALASNFNAAGEHITWQEGDLNYDHAVTIADFIDLAGNFNASYSGSAGLISDSDFAMLSSFAAAHGVTLVPEPAAVGLLMTVGSLLLRRRRDHSPREASLKNQART
jgi:T5SS/PEP-CTERM-associated repeat protein